MRFKCVAAAIAVLSFLSVPASAQTATPPALAETDHIAVPVWPTSIIALPETEPVPASFSLGKIDGIAPELLSGVTAKGFARKVSVDQESVGQVLVVSVAKGDREETISVEGMTAQFDATETSELFPEKTVEVQGSKAALIAALQRLATPLEKDADKPDQTDTVSENPVSGGSTSNDEASAYKAPAITPTTAREDDEPVVDIRISTDGCSVRIDTAQGKAFQQSKEQTFSDGALSGESQCTDSEVSFVLKQSYLACPDDIVDLPAMTAWPQYSLYYTDDAGENHSVGECTKDEEAPYAIIENESQCPIFLDFATSQAVPQAALVYTNRNNSVQQARSCDTSTTSAPLPMSESTDNCSLRHDYGAGISSELSMWTYVKGGVTYQAAPCADNGRTFTHEKIYTDSAGGYVCAPITNLDAKTVTLQSRKRITVDGVPQFITECTPDTTAQAILATTDGCMDPSKWTHDLDAGISYGQERFYYSKANGTREYVTTCQTSSVTYTHNQTTTGYQHHDGQLWSYALSTVTISVNGNNHTVASSEVLPGAQQMVYLLEGTVDQPSGTASYDGCDAYRETTRYERWARPDDTEYLKAIGAGTPEGPINVCVKTVVQSESRQTGNWWTTATGSTCLLWWNWETPVCATTQETYTTGTWNQTVTKTETNNTETGEIISSGCEFSSNTWKGWQANQQTNTCTYGSGQDGCAPKSAGATQTLAIPPCPF